MSGQLLFGGRRPEGAQCHLYQGEWWRDVTSQWHKIDEMTLGHVENVMVMLLREARRHAFTYTMGMIGHLAHMGENAADALERELDEIQSNPDVWLKSTPLYRALKKRRKNLKREIEKATKLREASERLLLLPDISINKSADIEWRFEQ